MVDGIGVLDSGLGTYSTILNLIHSALLANMRGAVTSDYMQPRFFSPWSAMKEHPRKHGRVQPFLLLHCAQWT